MSISSISSASTYQVPDFKEMSQRQFKKTDANQDDSISKDELATALENAPKGPDGTSAPDVDTVFSSMDTDGSGSITETEMSTAMEKNAPKGGPGMPPPDSGLYEEGVGSTLNTTV